MNRFWVALLASAVSGSALAQSAVLYQPERDIKDQGLSVRSWGSGTISETDEAAFEGTHSVRVSTHNFYQGGILSFATPVDLSKEYASKSNLLKITYKLADSAVINSTGRGGSSGKAGFGFGGAGAGAGAGASRPGGAGISGGGSSGKAGFGFGAGGVGAGGGQGRPPGGPGGAGFPGGPGGGQGFGGPAGGRGFGGSGGPGGTTTAPVLKSFRLIVTTSDGLKSEAYVPADTSAPGDTGWNSVALPLQAITGFDRTNKTIQSIAIAGNTTATFYVGDLRVIEDETPIRGNLVPDIHEMNLALGDEVTFSASGYGGASILRYTWDFDNRDGIQVDAEGQTVVRRFRKAGTYVVTVTISDYFDLKPPYSTTLKVTVNP